MIIGVLALQGAFLEHEKALRVCGVNTRQIRLPEQLNGLDGLVIPGGESTTMGKLLTAYELLEPIKQLAEQGLPVFGTCAGLIMMAKDIVKSNQLSLGLMDIAVERNAFGRQVDSFEADLAIPALGDKPYRAVFIRAPYIASAGSGVEVMAKYEEKIVLARQKNFLAAAFHPELTADLRLHQYFLNMIKK
ncbi:5'-phosphate synthase pdxT subunit [Desulfohalotomaculum tongense]|uniref:pyridoxal 5'-phosphate synthase glutaminase subunit PdxT n=1 Tax=Desulforadius tongensis TaxID=1216062 RepID=UPI00195B8FEA|nr:pyridoxal 5'-phosphate synthase glutaminase subunit PdxT [Desulforadius tongensis]MBM7855152.1 5'-phosphate synthase pdxT subunit [Desulforadius tongensis]